MAGTLSAIVSIVSASNVSAGFSGSGSLSAIAFSNYLTAVGFNGAGTFNAALWERYMSNGLLTGVGSLSAAGYALYQKAAPFSGSGALFVNAFASYLFTGVLGGGGSLAAIADAVLPEGVTWRSGASAAGNTVAMPTHVAGDLIWAIAFRDGSTIAPTLPAGWTTHGSSNNTGCAYILAWKTAASASETTGTWTNATSVAVSVYEKPTDATWYVTFILGETKTQNDSTTGSTMSWIDANWTTAPQPNVDKWFLRTAAHRTATNMTANIPAGWTARAGGVGECVMMDTNGPVSVSANSVGGNTQSVNTSSGWFTVTDTFGIYKPMGSVWKTGTSSASGTTAPSTLHKAGDLIIAVSRRTGSGTPPTLAAGWTNITSTGVGARAIRVAYKIAATDGKEGDNLGTWVNGTYTTYISFGKATADPWNTPTFATLTGSGTAQGFPDLAPSADPTLFVRAGIHGTGAAAASTNLLSGWVVDYPSTLGHLWSYNTGTDFAGNANDVGGDTFTATASAGWVSYTIGVSAPAA